jgi:ketosteroid isomerase-like protein
MRKILLCALVVLLLGGCHPKSHYSDLKSFTADITEIRSWLKNYTEAVKTADIERILAYESDDISYWPPNQPLFSGKENLRKWFLAYFNYCTPVESFNLIDFDVYGDFAYLTGKYSVSGKIKQGGEEFRDNGKFIDFFKRQPDGNWICTQSIWNSDNRTFDIHSQILDDFSGTWKLDLSKSINLPGIISSNLEIIQKGNNLNINGINEIKDKEPEKSSFNCTIGSEAQYKLKSGIFTTTSTLSSGRQTFTIKETLISEKSGLKQEYSRITIYTLMAKGEILSIISDAILPEEGSQLQKVKTHTEMVYTKL